MRAGAKISKLVSLGLGALLVMSCMLPGMIPLNRAQDEPTPTMETDSDKVIAVLNGQDWTYLEANAKEQYTAEDFARPGSLTYTVTIADDNPTVFHYGWCATSQEILQQNYEHIRLKLTFNGEDFSREVIHPLSFTQSNGMMCLDYVVLLSDWPAGEYKLEAVATFDQQINDGLSDYPAGDYAFEYNVTVQK